VTLNYGQLLRMGVNSLKTSMTNALSFPG
jgi:hypothetical protein